MDKKNQLENESVDEKINKNTVEQKNKLVQQLAKDMELIHLRIHVKTALMPHSCKVISLKNYQ